MSPPARPSQEPVARRPRQRPGTGHLRGRCQPSAAVGCADPYPHRLGSSVVLDTAGNIVTNANVAGNATTFQVQVANDPAPREAKLVGSYPSDELAVIRVDDTGSSPSPAAAQPTRQSCARAM